MKKIIIITIFFIYNLINAQDIDWVKNAEGHNPNLKNELSLYFKKQVSKKYLKKAAFAPRKNNIALSFLINSQNKPYAIKINAFSNRLLKKEILEAFESYPLEKLNLKNLDKKNRYHLQIISKKGNKNIFNCSSKVIVEQPPICNNCEDLEYFEDIKNCLANEVRNHLYNTLDFSLLNDIDEDSTNLYIKYSVTSSGLILNKKTKVPLFFKEEVLRALSTFPKIQKEGTLNDIKQQPLYSAYIIFKKGETPVYKNRLQENANFSQPKLESDLSLFFTEKLSEDDLKKINLNRIYNRFVISFEIDKNKKLFNINTNARSKEIDRKMIAVFKNFPFEKLNFADTTPFNRYSIQILSFTNNETIVKASSLISYIRIPVYPGCERSKNLNDAKKCFSKGVQKTFVRNFDTELPNRLGLASGKIKVLISFKVNLQGEVSNIYTKINRSSIALSNEVKRVMNLIPKMTFAPVNNGKPVNIKYSITFTLIVK
jgi:hypothetical protein